LQFEATVSINITVHATTTCIVLHAGNKMLFDQHSFHLDDTLVPQYSYDNQTGMLTLRPGTTLVAGDQHLLTLTYHSFVNDDHTPGVDGAHGVFLSPNTVPPPLPSEAKAVPQSLSEALDTWRLHQSQRRAGRRKNRAKNHRYASQLRHARVNGDELMVGTQFEESDARNMFPSFDEPSYKTTFAAQITVPLHCCDVFFNTPFVAMSYRDNATETHSFMLTKHPLPTYLIALAIGRFDTLERTSQGVRFRIITPPGYKSWATLAMNASVHAVEWFGEKYGLPYSDMNDKMDSISIGGIDMDAMENQGLLTYAPQMLLLNPDASQLPAPPCGEWGRFAQAQLIVLVTTHEIHHMWFGDTVTMRDWSQEYLNEGFTRFAQSYGADDLVPGWDMTGLTGHSKGRMNAFFQFSWEVAMTFDTPGTAPSIVYPIRGGGDLPPFPPTTTGDPPHVTAPTTTATTLALSLDPTKAPLFSRIFYEKGASVNRMVYTLLGQDLWFKALGTEIGRHLWQNPTVEDMMRSLDDAFVAKGQPLAIDAFLPWLRRPGYPIVTLRLEGTSLTATQVPMSKYLHNQQPWWIPLQVQLDDASAPTLLAFNTTNATMACGGTAPTTVIGDPSFWGFFIVRYDDDALWAARMQQSIANHATTPDYTRALIFQLSLMVHMSHEPTHRLTDMLVAVAPVLRANPKLGGWRGEGALYTMILQRTSPLVALLGGCGAPSCVAQHTALTAVLGQMTGSLAQRLAVEGSSVVEGSSAMEQSTRKGSSAKVGRVATGTTGTTGTTVPWPTSEDAGVETRDRQALRPLATLAAVVYDDSATIAMCLAMFRNHSTVPDTSLSRAVYFAAAKYGTDQDYARLVALLKSSTEATVVDDIVFGLTASAGIGQCQQALGWAAGSSTDVFAAVVDMLTYSWACRGAVETAAVGFAQEAWGKEGGSATTSGIVKALNLFATEGGVKEVEALLGNYTQYVSRVDAHAVVVNVMINVDMVVANSL